MTKPGTLYLFCGKMAAGKSTLARDLTARTDGILFVQDEWLGRLFPGEIVDIPALVKCSSQLRAALTDHICTLLSRGIPVVLDFAGNTKTQRAWFRELIERANANHELHFVDVSDELCKAQLRERSRHYEKGTKWTTEADFDAITKYFQPPAADEAFNIIRHER